MIERNTGYRAHFPALILKLVKQRGHQPSVIRDVDAVVIPFDPADEFSGTL
jgi:hypothetical protein